MTKGPRQKYRRAREAIDEQYDESEIDEATHARLGAFVDAYDGESLAVSTPSDGTNTASTLRAYARNLMRVAEDEDLVSADADDLNRLTGRMLSGEHPDIKDSGYSESTIQRYQSSLRSFYRYHDDLPVDPDDIALVETPDSPVEETDMFDSDDIQALRDACPNPRDRSFLELLINTGQRIRAIQALRVKDVDPDDGEFRLNPNVDGLKHAEGKRPLLAARAAVGD